MPKELATLDGDVCAILIIEAQLICQAAGSDPDDGLPERRIGFWAGSAYRK